MEWSDAQIEGFALAATACGDRDAGLGGRGLMPHACAEVTRVARALARGEPDERRTWVARTLAHMQELALARVGFDAARVQAARVPPRALALLAATVDKPVGARWIALTPLPRPGYVPEPALRTLLARLIARAAIEGRS